MKNLTNKQFEKIKDNYTAYTANFKEIEIIYDEVSKGFYIYFDKMRNNWTYCENIDYLNGWLWGAVMAANKRMQKLTEEEKQKIIEKRYGIK